MNQEVNQFSNITSRDKKVCDESNFLNLSHPYVKSDSQSQNFIFKEGNKKKIARTRHRPSSLYPTRI